MTTIAWDGKTLASDSQLTGSYVEQRNCKKLADRDGCLVGASGDAGLMKLFIEGEIECFPDDSVEALIINKKTGKAQYQGQYGRLDMPKHTAIGSGAPFAMGAMLAGKSAVDAVKIAIKLDPNSGGRVVSRSIDQTQKKRG